MTNDNRDNGGNSLAEWVKKNVAPLITLAALVTVIFTGYFWLDKHYANAEQLAQLEQRFEMKVKGDFLRETNTRIWQLEDRLRQKPDDVTAQEEVRKLKEEKSQLEREINQLQKAPR